MEHTLLSAISIVRRKGEEYENSNSSVIYESTPGWLCLA